MMRLRHAIHRPFPSRAASRSFTCTTRNHRQILRPQLPQSFAHDHLLKNKKILIANRGEIAIRIARAAESLGAKSIAVCAPEDVDSPHVSFADESVVLPRGKTAIAPYLDVRELTEVAVESGADFVHPGEIFYLSFDISKKNCGLI